MQTSVIGFPRIGTLRELKFASEKYFRGEISSQELLDTAKNLRKIHWTTQKNEGIDFIPSNDFISLIAVCQRLCFSAKPSAGTVHTCAVTLSFSGLAKSL